MMRRRPRASQPVLFAAACGALLAACNLDFAERELPGDVLIADTGAADTDATDATTTDTAATDADAADADAADTRPPLDLVSDCSQCAVTEICCEQPGGGAVCTRLESDPRNCGACHNDCGADSVCVDLVCCRPQTCAEHPAELCGTYADGCGDAITCDCRAPLACGLQTANRCAAVAQMRIPDSATAWCVDSTLIGDDGTCPQPGEARYGQDGNHIVHPPSWDLREPDLATDLVSGLQWARQPGPEAQDGAQAQAWCAASTLGGYTDWRLPNLFELMTALDHGKSQALYDEAVFGSQPLGLLLTRTPGGVRQIAVATGDGTVQGVGFGRALCVRGTTPPGSYTALDAQGTLIEDSSLGLMWSLDPTADNVVWDVALSACEILERDGFDDWRLPSLRELVSLLEPRDGAGAAADAAVFAAIELGKDFWSATPVVQADATFTDPQIWSARIDRVEVRMVEPGNTRHWFCVRNTDLAAPDPP